MRLLVALLVLVPALASGVLGAAGPYRLDVVSDPATLPVGKATLDVFVADGSGKAVDGAIVKAIAQMPNMAMGEREQAAVPTGVPGHYRFAQSFSMAGGYEARIAVSGPLGSGTATVPLETGRSTATVAQGGSSVFSLWPWAVGLALVAFTLLRMRQTGQRLDPRRALNGPTLGALAALGVVTAVAVYAVGHFRRQGAMTPVEAQTMQMDTPPPEGALPVTLATVANRPFAASVRYSGQAVGYVEQEVNARTGGVIVWMPAYVGTRVRKGQVVARLDTSQLAPQVAQSQAMVSSAREGVGVAEADYRQALAMIDQAEAERGQYEGAVEEARANLAASRDERESAVAGVASAQADERYWEEELKREASLFAAGAVSKDEYDRERADAAKSQASAQAADEQVRSAEAKARTAEAMVRRDSASVTASQRKVDQARAGEMAHHAHVETERAAAASARQKIAQSSAGVRQAQAGLQGVAAQAGYAEIRSEVDGVVTQRSIGPGTLVAPGQTILRLAQVQPIRLQVNVPMADLSRIRVGTTVTVSHQEGAGKPTRATVSSVSPAVDAVSRTGVVEVVVPNLDGAFLPGQFLSFGLTVGSPGEKTVVPSAAVQTSVAGGDGVQAGATSTYVWVASPIPGQNDRFTVSRRTVEAGDRTDDRVAIRSGLKEGERVVVMGAAGLSEGDTVSAPATSKRVAETVVSITENGFEPATLTLPAGGDRTVTFVRKTDKTCAKQVVFPSLKITRDLPLDQPVRIELPPSGTGMLGYVCGMNMLKGKVILR